MSAHRVSLRLSFSRIAQPVLVGVLALLLLTGARTFAQAPSPSDPDNPLHTATREELDVVKVLLAQENAWNNGDIDSYAKGYLDSPDTLFVGRQISKGYAQMLDDYKHNYPTRSSMGTLTFSELEVHSLSDAFAICVGKYHLDRSKKEGGPADGLFSVVMQKTDKGWKIVLDHTT